MVCRDRVGVLVLIWHGLGKLSEPSCRELYRWTPENGKNPLTSMNFFIPIGILFTEFNAKFPEPTVVFYRLPRPKGARMFLVDRLEWSIIRITMVNGTKHLSCLKRHLNNVFVTMPLSASFMVPVK